MKLYPPFRFKLIGNSNINYERGGIGLARDKNKDELQTHQRDLELRQEAQDYKEDINLPEQRLHGMDNDSNEDKKDPKK